ncbi:MAG TPA: hypothetical protein VEA44_10555 [Caulobacter sp.]|nr:hypothetical protein [Caulobacter sp.]
MVAFRTRNGFFVACNEPTIVTIFGAGGPRVITQTIATGTGGGLNSEGTRLALAATFEATIFQDLNSLRKRTARIMVPMLRRAAAKFASGELPPEVSRREGKATWWSTSEFRAVEADAPYERVITARVELRCSREEPEARIAARAIRMASGDMRAFADDLHGAVGSGDHAGIFDSDPVMR